MFEFNRKVQNPLKEIANILKVIKFDQKSCYKLTISISISTFFDLLIDFFILLIEFFNLLIDFFNLLIKYRSISMKN